jgi:hypothetical protein
MLNCHADRHLLWLDVRLYRSRNRRASLDAGSDRHSDHANGRAILITTTDKLWSRQQIRLQALCLHSDTRKEREHCDYCQLHVHRFGFTSSQISLTARIRGSRTKPFILFFLHPFGSDKMNSRLSGRMSPTGDNE